tara:strand:+ start:13194 stop:13982 length:789 start_codon:yes stop_codon:yes gene_type:complete
MKIAQETLSAASQLNDPKSFFEALKEKNEFLPPVEEMLQDPDLICHFTKPTNKKSTPPPEERRGVIEEHKCDARVWKEKPKSGGLGYDNIQCSSKKVEGFGCFCKKHFKLFEEGKLWLGKVTEERPKDPVHPTAGPKMWSTDEDGNEVVKEKKKRKSPSKEKKARKPRKKKSEGGSLAEMAAGYTHEELLQLLEIKNAQKKKEEEAEAKEEKGDDEGTEVITVGDVEYQHEKETHVLTRMTDFAEVGKWNVETGEIDFNEED